MPEAELVWEIEGQRVLSQMIRCSRVKMKVWKMLVR